jgi:nitrous oxide reductase
MKYLVTWENKVNVIVLAMQVDSKSVDDAIDTAHKKLSKLFREDQIQDWQVRDAKKVG